jgi:hypothetical protein
VAAVAVFGLLASGGTALAAESYTLGKQPHHVETAADGGFGTTILSGIDDGPTSQALPFDFPFYGSSYRQVLVDPNGLVMLDGAAYRDFCSGADLLQQHVAIAPLWSDWQSASVSYLALADHVVFTWSNAQHYQDDQGSATFQAALYADGRVEFNYGSDTASLAATTVGIAGGSAGALLVTPDGQRATSSSTTPSYAFLPPGSVAPTDGDPLGGADPTATPELNSGLLFASGALGLLGYARLRRRARRP